MTLVRHLGRTIDLSIDPMAGDSVAEMRVPSAPSLWAASLEGLVAMNEQLLTAGRYPALYDSGVVYHTEPREVFRTAKEVLAHGWGDCDDLAGWRVAELHVSGEDPGAWADVYRTGPNRLHAIVARSDGRIEDPSLILGMPVSEGRRATMPQTIHDLGAVQGGTDAGPVRLSGVDEDENDLENNYDDDGDGNGFLLGASEADPDFDEGDDDGDDDGQAAEDEPEPQRPTRPRARKRSKLRRAGRLAFKAATAPIKYGLRYGVAAPLSIASKGFKKISNLFGEGGLEPWQIGAEVPTDDHGRLTVNVEKAGGAYGAIVRIPTENGRTIVLRTSPSATEDEAAQKAVNLARLASRTPEMRAAATPEAKHALANLAKPGATEAFKAVRTKVKGLEGHHHHGRHHHHHHHAR